MSLQISEFLGIFSVHGKLNADNVHVFHKHMNPFIEHKDKIVLNLERTEEMDVHGAYALQDLAINATELNCAVSIFGRDNKNILPVLKRTKIYDMFSDFM